MVVRRGFVFFISIVCLSFNAKNFFVSTLTHDQKKDMIAEAYTSLKNVVQSLLDLDDAIQSGDSKAEKHISELQDTKARVEYQVNVMNVEHQLMLAEAAKRSDVSSQEADDAKKRGKAIDEAEKAVEKLNDEIAKTQSTFAELNTQMKAATLSTAFLKNLQDRVNKDKPDTLDHITLPSIQEIKTRVDEQLANIQTVIETVPASNPVRAEAEELKANIEKNFDVVLNENPGHTLAQLRLTLKQIDVDLLRLRDHDIYDSAAKMEL